MTLNPVGIEFEVSQKDIEDGFPGDSKCCMLWQCLHRMFPNNTILVGVRNVYIDDMTYKMDERAYQLRRDFDRNKVVQAGSKFSLKKAR